MAITASKILDHSEIKARILRMSYQIYEINAKENHVIIAGIAAGGYNLAALLKKQLENISDLEITLCKVVIDKKNPRKPIETSIESSDYKNKSLVLVDDVLNSGTTLMYGVRHFLDVPLKRFKTAVLVDRNHKKYPIKADFKGISLSTSLNETIEVVLTGNSYKALLK